MTTAVKPASEKQIDYAKSLLAGRVHSVTEIPESSGEVSKLIDWLKRQPTKPALVVPAAEQLTAGIYLAPNGDIIKVKLNKAKTNVYAQVMVAASGGARINLHDEIVPKFDFVYVAGLIRHITPAMKLTLEDAKAFYTKTGRCLNCKKELKVAASIEKGLGPVCAKMFS